MQMQSSERPDVHNGRHPTGRTYTIALTMLAPFITDLERARRRRRRRPRYGGVGFPSTHDPAVPMIPPMAIMVSPAEIDHQSFLRVQSYELAIARGHIHR